MNKLTQNIELAAQNFAKAIVDLITQASLQELLELQNVKTSRGPGRPAKVKAEEDIEAAKPRKKRKKHDYPKCAHPECNKNKWARGEGFCGEHYKAWKARKIKAAKHYLEATG